MLFARWVFVRTPRTSCQLPLYAVSACAFSPFFCFWVLQNELNHPLKPSHVWSHRRYFRFSEKKFLVV